MDRLQVLTVVQTERGGSAPIISCRPASEQESEVYYEWTGQEDD